MNAYNAPTDRLTLRQRLRSLLGRPLVSEQADEARRLAAALGVELTWKRVWLNPQDEEKAGRQGDRETRRI